MDGEAFSKLARTRRSVRDFDPERTVDEDLIKRILSDAAWSPSWCNVAPYRICVARGAQRDRLAQALTAKYDAATGGATTAAVSAGTTTTTTTGTFVRSVLAKIGLWLKGGAPDGDYNTLLSYDDELQIPRRACGHGLYELLGIARHDRAARAAQTRRNFEFFGAPLVIFVFVHGDMGPFSPLDVGFFLQTLVLSAHANGLGTCVQG